MEQGWCASSSTCFALTSAASTSGGAGSVLAAMLSTYNTAILTVVAGIMVYTHAAGIADTAHKGELDNQRHHTLWCDGEHWDGRHGLHLRDQIYVPERRPDYCAAKVLGGYTRLAEAPAQCRE